MGGGLSLLPKGIIIMSIKRQHALPLTSDQEKAIASAPPRYRQAFRNVLEGTAPPRQVHRIMCYQCMGWEGNGYEGQQGTTLQEEVANCTSRRCPLHPYRPK